MSIRRLTLLLATMALAAFAITGGAVAGPGHGPHATPMGGHGKHSKLTCFSDAPATCTLNAGATSATLNTTAGGDAGVYFKKTDKKLSKAKLRAVKFSFQYVCADSTTTTCVTGGSPRWSIPIDTHAKPKAPTSYAFVDANNCGKTGTVNNNCPVFFGTTLYPNWAAFATANPKYRIAKAIPFVIADQPFSGTISNVSISKKK